MFVASPKQDHVEEKSEISKKIKNLKELLNLLIAENQDITDLNISNSLNLSDFRLLADYLVFKLKTSDNFNLLVDKKEFDENDDFHFSRPASPSPSKSRPSSPSPGDAYSHQAVDESHSHY